MFPYKFRFGNGDTSVARNCGGERDRAAGAQQADIREWVSGCFNMDGALAMEFPGLVDAGANVHAAVSTRRGEFEIDMLRGLVGGIESEVGFAVGIEICLIFDAVVAEAGVAVSDLKAKYFMVVGVIAAQQKKVVGFPGFVAGNGIVFGKEGLGAAKDAVNARRLREGCER